MLIPHLKCGSVYRSVTKKLRNTTVQSISYSAEKSRSHWTSMGLVWLIRVLFPASKFRSPECNSILLEFLSELAGQNIEVLHIIHINDSLCSAPGS